MAGPKCSTRKTLFRCRQFIFKGAKIQKCTEFQEETTQGNEQRAGLQGLDIRAGTPNTQHEHIALTYPQHNNRVRERGTYSQGTR